jgi:hypothetical protein
MKKRLFCVPVPIADNEIMHHVTVAIEKSGALTDKPARELSAVSQEQSRTVM